MANPKKPALRLRDIQAFNPEAPKPATARKAAKPVTRWMHKSEKYGLVGRAYVTADGARGYMPVHRRKSVYPTSIVRVRIVELRR